MDSDSIASDFSYIGRKFAGIYLTDASASSSAFSECNSDHTGEFYTASLSSVASVSDYSEGGGILQLVLDLESSDVDVQKQAAMELRLLSKNNPDNRIKIATAGAIKPLIAIVSSSDDTQLQEYGVTAILNLSLCDENKDEIARSGAIQALVRALLVGTETARENAACALFRLSQVEKIKIGIGRYGAIPPLVKLLEHGSLRGKKDACTALYSLCSVKENKIKAVEAGIMRPLVEMMADLSANMVDKAAFVLNLLVSLSDARAALVNECGIPVLVEIVEVGTQRQKEVATAILLQLCLSSSSFRTTVAREGPIPSLIALSQTGTSRAKQKAEALIEILRQPRVTEIVPDDSKVRDP